MNTAPPHAETLHKQLRYAAVIGFLLGFPLRTSVNLVSALQHVGDDPGYTAGLITGYVVRILVGGGMGTAFACLVVWLRWKWVHRGEQTQANEQPHARYWQSCPECARRGQQLAAQGRRAEAVQTVTQSEHAEAALRFMGTRRCREIIASGERSLGHGFSEQEARQLLFPHALNEWLPPPREPLTVRGIFRLIGALLFLLLILGMIVTGALRVLGFNVGSDAYCDFLGGPDCP